MTVKLRATERGGRRPDLVDWDELLRERDVQTLIELALREALGTADVTTEAIFDTAQQVRAAIVTRSETVEPSLTPSNPRI